MAHLVVVRGLPGSGKTTFAVKNYPTYEHLETDKLFMRNGVYQFDPRMLGKYHSAVQAECAALLKNGQNVVVSNTFTTMWELKPYLNMTENVSVFSMGIPIGLRVHELADRNVHGVPVDTIFKMMDRWEGCEGEYVVRYIGFVDKGITSQRRFLTNV